MSKKIWTPQSPEEEILGQPLAQQLLICRCFRCGKAFKSLTVTTACEQCKILMMAEAHAAMTLPNGNLGPNVDRIAPGGRTNKADRVIRIKIAGEA